MSQFDQLMTNFEENWAGSLKNRECLDTAYTYERVRKLITNICFNQTCIIFLLSFQVVK